MTLPSWSQHCCPEELLCGKLTGSSHPREGSYWPTRKQDREQRSEQKAVIMAWGFPSLQVLSVLFLERVTVTTKFTEVIHTNSKAVQYNLFWPCNFNHIRVQFLLELLYSLQKKQIQLNYWQWGLYPDDMERCLFFPFTLVLWWQQTSASWNNLHG